MKDLDVVEEDGSYPKKETNSDTTTKAAEEYEVVEYEDGNK